MSAGSAWSAGSARSAWSALDYDFDWFVIEHEYCVNRKDNPGDEPNENDKKYLEYSELLMQAKEYGLGYRVEWEDTLYLVPTPLVKIDDQNRFHSEDSPAIKWKGGKEFYFWHDTSVSEKLIMTPEKITKRDILKETNAEKRRCIYEKLGAERYAKVLGIKQVNRGERGVLYKTKDKDELVEDYLYFVKVVCPTTQRVYFLGTEEKNDADLAVARSFGMSKEEYQPSIES